MSETYIHVGFPKTASTLIQSEIFAKLEGFRNLLPGYTQNKEHWNRLQYGDDTQFDISTFLKDHAENTNPAPKLLISDEGLVGKYLYGGLQRTSICDRLQSAFPDAKILIVIRGQFDMLKSLHNQWVKGYRRGTTTFGEFIWWKRKPCVAETNPLNIRDHLQFNTNSDHVHLDFLDYHKIIKLYKSRFEEVKVVLFETLRKEPTNFYSNIYGFLNVTPVEQEIKIDKINQGIKGRELAKLIAANSLKNLPLSKLEAKALIIRTTQSIFRKNENEYEMYEEPIQEYFKASNTELIEQFPEIGIQNHPEYYRFST